ncbi:60S ribosomal protein L18a [Microtus ochrogaster]|uniref:Large ribosomal subunit protein eL20 n=1 Tax=Microtus ochrogaster TaxID=79684 RepID=A0A8J6KJX4_MICOH|nr:60S ribosomal protein L18a [Microtus ochrogaster]
MYSQYCDLTPAGAVIQCYPDMGAQHHAYAQSIQIMKVEEIAACRVASMNDSKFKFPLPHCVLRRLHKSHFTTKRSNTF